MESNIFTLRSSRIENGAIKVAFSEERGRYEARLGSQSDYSLVRFGNKKGSHTNPIHIGENLIRAKAGWWRHHPRLIRPERDWKGVILHVIARDLRFGFAAPFAQDLNLNAGGEGKDPFAFHGRHKDVAIKEQLFELENGESMLVVDRDTGIAQVSCRDGSLSMRPAEKSEVCPVVEQYALASNHVQTLDWAISLLCSIGGYNLRRLKERRAEY